MIRSVVAALLGLTMVGLLPAPATAAEGTGRKICPTEDFWVGAGWGAERGKRAHAGIDLGGKRGTPIYAVEKGVIDRTKLQSNGALQIVMKGASGSKYYYGHMDKVLVSGGQKVRAGEVIGLMGDTGSPGAVHLHFEYWRSGRESDPVNPERLIERICAAGAPAAAVTEPAAKPEPAVDPTIAGDVFEN
jgi:murein DD-endopeptidase MepM/ murein hydrolase activator NlpD